MTLRHWLLLGAVFLDERLQVNALVDRGLILAGSFTVNGIGRLAHRGIPRWPAGATVN